ncbi:hypothetical protein RhiirA1_476150 [Rhizophagus irregularis]|uniref:Uncharacterized protein n=1 Tax=Rhizophagus irregularis TaxID=588596 RepID=A0A2N0QVM6_9GLOM|nr:hypothetical protein RhiirA1_476150 [Rhizophagus irregularis]
MKDGNRFLGIFFTHNNNRWVHIEKIEKMIKGFVKVVNKKILTDKQVAKLWNVTLIPAIEYQLLGIVITRQEAEKLMTPVNILMKHKSNMPKSLPNCIIYDKDIYGIKDIYNLQLECISKNIMYLANGNEELNKIFKIQMRKLQQKYWSVLCVSVMVTSDKFPTKMHVGDALIILNENNFKICNHKIIDDQFPNH